MSNRTVRSGLVVAILSLTLIVLAPPTRSATVEANCSSATVVAAAAEAAAAAICGTYGSAALACWDANDAADQAKAVKTVICALEIAP